MLQMSYLGTSTPYHPPEWRCDGTLIGLACLFKDLQGAGGSRSISIAGAVLGTRGQMQQRTSVLRNSLLVGFASAFPIKRR